MTDEEDADLPPVVKGIATRSPYGTWQRLSTNPSPITGIPWTSSPQPSARPRARSTLPEEVSHANGVGEFHRPTHHPASARVDWEVGPRASGCAGV